MFSIIWPAQQKPSAKLGLAAHPRLALIHRAERVLFIREMRNGESYTVYSGILSMADDTLTTFSEIHNLDNETIAARFIIDLQLTDLDNGQAANFVKSALRSPWRLSELDSTLSCQLSRYFQCQHCISTPRVSKGKRLSC